MGRIVAALASFACLIWLLYFTEINLLQSTLIAGMMVANFIGDRFDR